jgi:hypothetical protein
MAPNREQATVNVKVMSATITAEDLLKRLNLKADRQWLAGSPRGAFGAIEKNHGFELESKLGPTSSLEMHVAAMVDRLKACAQALGALAKEVTVEFNCAITRRRAPMLHFDRDTVRWIAVMGAKLEIDTQVLVDAPPPPKAGGAGGAAGGGTTSS